MTTPEKNWIERLKLLDSLTDDDLLLVAGYLEKRRLKQEVRLKGLKPLPGQSPEDFERFKGTLKVGIARKLRIEQTVRALMNGA